MTIRYGAAAVALAIALAAAGTACGRDGGDEAGGPSVPKSLRKAQSAAEDSIGLILAGKRAETMRRAVSLDQLAQGELAEDLEGIATKEELGELQGRAAELAQIAPEGEPIEVALAANRVFEPIARVFGRFASDVPGAVMMLGYYDFEAKLRALAGQLDGVRSAVDRLSSTWTELVKTFPAGEQPAATRSRFEAHAGAMASLVAAGTDFEGMAREADRGLEIVDELAAVYSG